MVVSDSASRYSANPGPGRLYLSTLNFSNSEVALCLLGCRLVEEVAVEAVARRRAGKEAGKIVDQAHLQEDMEAVRRLAAEVRQVAEHLVLQEKEAVARLAW